MEQEAAFILVHPASPAQPSQQEIPKAPTLWLACPYCHAWILRIKNQSLSLKNHVGFFSCILLWGFNSLVVLVVN